MGNRCWDCSPDGRSSTALPCGSRLNGFRQSRPRQRPAASVILTGHFAPCSGVAAVADTPPPPDDHTIDGYQIVSTIAMGGTGQVLEVLEPGTSRRLAMKLLNTKHPDFADHKMGLKHEAKVLKLL